ncbi:MAG: bifunctional precorrin-2 dehydrogenase/sirohydrochlorin ferrochelatase [Selenomonadaceae bacterium]|nr:bifunctional precorrin-2 dehydrogenase/sirohydrochlorin ferrochelatase [Selenomonadaceae bacterium]
MIKISYPINLELTGKSCAVIGGGKVALRKIRGLLETGARVKVIAPEVCTEIESLRREIILLREKFSPEMIDDEILIIAATDNPEVNQQVTAAAHDKNILVNNVNGGGDFDIPSRIRHGDFLLTISTGANSPAFSKFVRLMLENELGENFGTGLALIARRRQEVKKILPNPNARKNFWRDILTSETWAMLKSGRLDELEAKINHALESYRA